MNVQPLPKTPDAAAARRLAAACADFLKSLGHAVQLVSLYGPAHLVSSAALRDCWLTASTLLDGDGREKITLALHEGRWIVSGMPAADESQSPDALRKLLRRHAVRSLTLRKGLKLFELSALCELASAAPQAEDWENAGEFLALKGVTRLSLNAETFTAAPSKAATPPTPSTPAAAPAPTAPKRSFAGLLRGLVEESVQDEEERAHLYEEALGLVKEALDRQVAAATARIKAEKQSVIRERLRTEQVISAVAEGKVVVDQDGKVMNMNPAAEAISGLRLSELAGKPLAESLAGGERIVVLADGAGKGGELGVRAEADPEVRRAFGRSLAVVHDLQGRVIGTCAVLPDAAKLKELQSFEEDLLSRVTHELKAPLTALCAALEIVTDKTSGRLDAETGRFLDSCRRNTDRLQKTINDILSFSRLRAGRMEVHPSSLDVEPVLREAVESLTPWARKQNLVLGAGPLPPDIPPVRADRERLLQILNNLVSNAIKSTPAGGRVTVSVEAGRDARAGFAVFAVRDTGCGIPEADQARIFQEFVRVEDRARTCEGIGLGLAIVRELVDRHGGAVWVESREGQGSAFFFTIPFAR